MSILDPQSGDDLTVTRNDNDSKRELESYDALKMILMELQKLNKYMEIIVGEKL